jgi:hypothetical protein
MTRLESDSAGSKVLDRFLLRSTRETQQASFINVPQEENYAQQRVRANNVVSSTIQKRVTTQQATSIVVPQQDIHASESELAERPHFAAVPRELCNLDEGVLAALSEDIRQEVLQTYQSSSRLQAQRDDTVTNNKSTVTEQVLECYHNLVS